MAIANGLVLPNPLSNGTTADAVQLMADLNTLLSAANRALIDSGGGAGMNAQSTQIHNLANGTSANDAVNLSQLGAYALLAGAAFTGAISGTAFSFSGNGSVGNNMTAVGFVLASTLHEIYSVDGTDIGIRVSGSGPFAKLYTSGTYANSFGLDAASGGPLLLSTQGTVQLRLNTDGSGVFAGPLSGITALAMGGALSGVTTLAASGALTPGNAANCVGFLGIPSTAQTANYTLALTDVGRGVNMNGASLTLTIPANASVAIPADTIILVTNLNASNLSIAITSDTLTLSGTTTTGTRTLGQNGEARLRKVSATSWLISGTNLS